MTNTIFRIFGDQALVQKLNSLPDRVRAAMTAKMQAMASELSDYIKQDKLSGQVLNAVSGKLRASIYARVYTSGSRITLSTGSRGEVPYAAIHEYGGHTAAHEILPSKARVLAFMRDGAMNYALSVNHPGSDIPERSYIRSALEEKSALITAALTEALVSEAHK